ncbi:hypothetical protein WJX73_009936 [Symbiochloris irregularis]|uniref:Alpha N-terminal protein methyltransferase 1 n=1 Tax=Symbiochloris irregularis TaxID=706552 RepID=A0AAW1NW75_9CHLO
MDQAGTDAEGQDIYSSPQDLWAKVDADKDTVWYGAAVAYWDKQEASDDGVLGGHGEVSAADIEESDKLLQRAFGQQMKAAAANGEQLVALDCGAGNFEFDTPRYHVIWVQWALLYLTDDDAISFFARCRAGLRPGGIIVLKENICTKGFVVDKEDASLTRSNAYLLQLFSRAKMQVLLNVQQRKFPKDLFKVRMYALKPADL